MNIIVSLNTHYNITATIGEKHCHATRLPFAVRTEHEMSSVSHFISCIYQDESIRVQINSPNHTKVTPTRCTTMGHRMRVYHRSYAMNDCG